MATKYLKTWSTPLSSEEIQIKAVLRFHNTPGRMAVIKKFLTTNVKKALGKEVNFFHCSWEYKFV